MHIENLRFFYEVAQAKSISTVAKASHISQSALSQQLLKLEDNLNVKLFVRSNKGVTLTAEGEIVYKHCEMMLNTYGKMIEEIDSINLNQNLVTIDGDNILTSTLIPMVISRIGKNFPNHIFKIISSESNSNNLVNSISDVNISYYMYPNSHSIISKELYKDKLVLIADKNFNKDILTLDEFLKSKFIMINDNVNIKRILSEKLIEFGENINSLKVLFTSDNYHSAIVGIRNTSSLAYIPYSVYYATFKDLGYKIIQVEDFDFPLTMYINYSEQLNKREKQFITKFTSILRGLLKS